MGKKLLSAAIALVIRNKIIIRKDLRKPEVLFC